LAYKIFVSHSWADRWLASQIERRMSEIGAATFIDINDIEKGDDIESRIFDEMETCNELFALFTPWSVDRNWLWVEIGAARVRKIRIVAAFYAISLSSIEAEKGGVTFLKAKNAVDINELETYFNELEKRVKKAAL
jgi:predicted RNase H-related nuclease YkuK (DUF458 family)